MKKNEDIMRKCIVTGEVKEKSHLLRFVLTPEKQIVPDFYKKLPGKGVYVSISYAVLQQAITKNLFSKVLKKNVKVSGDLLQIVENILHKNALDAISLAKKAGNMVIGMDKVLDVLKEDKAQFLLEAIDAGGDGQKKLSRYIEKVKVYRLFSVEELDKALDKGNTVYLAFLKQEMSKMVQDNLEKLSAFLKDKNNGE
ncbi:MAG: RNA-binding protein [Alphaproteobacteria bacterium]|nr:RNA-binding protein [Alphaproteobacteria bacterium]